MTPLVLLAGMNCSRDLWSGCGLDDAIAPELAEPDIEVQVQRLLERLPERFVLGGLSLGAIVAMALVVRAPHRVAGLVLASTNAKAPSDAQRHGWRDWLDRLDEGVSPRDLQSMILPLLLSDHARATRPDIVERTLAMGDATGVATLRSQLSMQATRTDLRPGLADVAVPALIVSGARDAICPPSFHAELAAVLPAAELVSIDGGHLLPMERPDEFGDVVRPFAALCAGG